MRAFLQRAKYYAFAPFLPIVAYIHGELGVDPIVDPWILAALAISIAIYAATPKTIFRAIYFNFLMVWFCFGTMNFIVHRLLWLGFEADIIGYHRLCALFLLVYTVSANVLGRDIAPGPISTIERPVIDMKFATRVGVCLVVLMAALLLPAVGWTGVFGGTLNDENRFRIAVNPLVPRLSLAFPYLACVLAFRFSRRQVSLPALALFFGVAFYVLSIMGARFGFFQVMITSFMFLLFSGELRLLRKYRGHVAIAVAFLVAVQLVMPTLRTVVDKPDDVESFSSAVSFLSGWGDEHRDAAASLELISAADRSAISDNYLASVVFPLIPDPVLSVFGLDKARALQGGAAYYMQKAYDIEDGTIRIGGIAEAYFWLGWLGVAIVAFANAWAAGMIDRVIYQRKPKSFTAVAFAAYGSVWLFYFVASQANMLLGSYGAFIVMHYAIHWVARQSGRAVQVPSS